MEQLGLFSPLETVDYRELTPGERFAAFHEANPQVYRAIVRTALDARARGVERWSIAAIFEVLRWESLLSTDGEPWKLPNAYRSRYARLVMEREPELRGFFRTAKLRGGDE